MGVRKESHKTRVLNFLRENKSITSLQAINEFGNTRLASTIYSLRSNGHNIVTKEVQSLNRYGDKVSIARYVLLEDSELSVNN